VSPYGHLIERAGSGPETLYVDLDVAEVAKAREALPVLANRVRL
jgi:predicted amidohydrolase